MKKKIYFLAPKNEGGTYFYYKEISDYLIKNYSHIYDIYFCNSLKDYIKLHFIKSDVIFSIIPFVFKPLQTRKYFYNLHGNYKIERKNNGLGVKLLYLSELNLWFSNKIILTSFYLADKLNFRKKYDNKIEILPNFVSKIEENKKIFNKEHIELLTVSSANFLEKGLGVYDLAKEVFNINNLDINWKIVLPGDSVNKNIIINKINSLEKKSNITVELFDFIEKNKLDEYYKDCNIFVYASNLETWGGTIMEACSFGKPIILLNNDLWKYVYPKEFIANNFENRFYYILNNYNNCSEDSLKFVKKYKIDKIVNKILYLIK